MNAYESLFERKLKKAIDDLLTSKRNTLESGYPADFAEYREAVGYFKALKAFTALIEDISAELNREEEI